MILGSLSTRRFWVKVWRWLLLRVTVKWLWRWLPLRMLKLKSLLNLFCKVSFYYYRKFVSKSGRNHCPSMWNVPFRFPSMDQERRLLKLSVVVAWQRCRTFIKIRLNKSWIPFCPNSNTKLLPRSSKKKIVLYYEMWGSLLAATYPPHTLIVVDVGLQFSVDECNEIFVLFA